jgi:hypothetical protein
MTSDNRSAHRPTTEHPTADHPTDQLVSDHPGDYLSALLDRELDPATAQSVNRHVDTCSACLTELTSLDRVRRIIRELPPVTAPPDFVTGLVDERQRANRRGMAIAGMAACLVVVMSLVVAEPLHSTEPAATDIVPDPDLVRLGSNQTRDGDELERSMLDRAHAAASDLLEFLAG